MPIIRAGKTGNGLVSTEYEGDKFKFTHAEDVGELAKYCYEVRKESNNGFSKERQFRRIASIPVLAWYELLKKCGGNVTDKDIRDYLRSEEGEMFKTVNKGI